MENRILALNDFRIENALVEDDVLKIAGYCAHYNTANLNDEVVDAHSFDTFFRMYDSGKIKPHLTWEHTDTVIGGIDSLESKSNGLWMAAHLNNNVKIVNEMIMPNVLKGDIDSLSTEGWIQGGYDGIVQHKDGSYYVKDFILTAVSVVRTPADSNAIFSVRNYIEEFKRKPKRKIYLL